MNHFTGYGSYLLFLALRTHFTSQKYDFFRMNGKLRASKESYLRRNDKWFYEKLAKENNAEELRDHYVANLLEDKQYILEFTDEEASMVHADYKRRKQSLSYVCANDMDRVFNQDDPRVSFATSQDRYPHIVILFLRKSISLETMVILDDFIGYVDKFDKYYEDDVIWPKISLKVKKFRPFLKYDKEKFKHILKEKVDENTRGKCI